MLREMVGLVLLSVAVAFTALAKPPAGDPPPPSHIYRFAGFSTGVQLMRKKQALQGVFLVRRRVKAGNRLIHRDSISVWPDGVAAGVMDCVNYLQKSWCILELMFGQLRVTW